MTQPQLLLHQVRLNQRSFWRNPESAFFSFAMPLGVLLIFGATSGNETVPGRDDVDVLTLFVPGILAFAIVVVAYGNLAATVALQRAAGVLKRIRATPLNPTVYLGGQILSVLATTLLISAVTVAAGGLAFGALPRAEAVPQLLVVLGLGIACFAALGVAISAAIPTADTAGAVTNGTYLPLAMVSGMFSASLRLPPVLDTIVGAFPLKALADGLRSAYDPAVHGLPVADTAVLLIWTIAGIALARRFFRWNPERSGRWHPFTRGRSGSAWPARGPARRRRDARAIARQGVQPQFDGSLPQTASRAGASGSDSA
jgi:ABC-2 type transport system permease protein